ncbi:MAG: hypothetical protein PHI85_04125 [Victivallaceae bacterium]|nr:hypothetical protein [Victivallaceae bacterium]
MSRTYVIAISLTVVVYIMLVSKRWWQIFQYGVFFIVLFWSFQILMDHYFPNTIQSTLARFEEEDVTSGRTGIFVAYNEYMLNNPLYILVGIGNLAKSAKVHLHSPHNAIQELFVAWGVVGMVLMFFIIKNMYLAFKIRQHDLKPLRIAWLPFVPFIVSIQAGQLFSLNEQMLYFALCFIALQIHGKDKWSEKNDFIPN